MRVVLQRVREASVVVDGETVGAIEQGLLLLVGLGAEDTEEDLNILAKKTAFLRVFEDDEGKMNLSVQDIKGSILAVSQFTLLADTRRGRRPSFAKAMHPSQAEPMFEQFVDILRKEYSLPVETGVFGADMKVSLCNDGPVTIVLETPLEPRRKK
jgi:D-tyrosyl-tRNA(Tyr) deacylase